MTLSDAAKLGLIVDTADPNFHTYNCHMAVIYWARLAKGKTNSEAENDVQSITRHFCNNCGGVGNCAHRASLDNMKYGKYFCQGLAIELGDIPTANDVEVGDVVLIAHPSYPIHSMVVVEKSTDNRIGIRGFNNKGTFSDAPFLEYDHVTRWLDERPNPSTNIVYRIPEASFLAKVGEIIDQIDLEQNTAPKAKSCCTIL